MESLPAILRWLLEQQPPGFVDVVAVPLWQLVTRIQYLLQSKTPTTARLLSSIFSVSREYQVCLSSEAAASRYPAKSIERILMRVALCQSSAMDQAYELYRAECNVITSPHLQQLLCNPAFVQTNMLRVAGWCKFKQEERQHMQQGRGSRGTSTRTSSSLKQGSRTSRQHTSSSSSSSAVPLESALQHPSLHLSSSLHVSSSSTSAAVHAVAAAGPGSFEQLEVPPDHDLAAAALGRAALAVQASYTKLQFASAARRGSSTPLGIFLELAFQGLLTAARSAIDAERLLFSSAVDLQLLLELLALAGAEVEEGGDGMMVLLSILVILNSGMHTVSLADRRVFLAARTSMMLQVLNLMLALIRQPKASQPQSEAAVEGACLDAMADVINVREHGGEGGCSNSNWRYGTAVAFTFVLSPCTLCQRSYTVPVIL